MPWILSYLAKILQPQQAWDKTGEENFLINSEGEKDFRFFLFFLLDKVVPLQQSFISYHPCPFVNQAVHHFSSSCRDTDKHMDAATKLGVQTASSGEKFHSHLICTSHLQQRNSLNVLLRTITLLSLRDPCTLRK